MHMADLYPAGRVFWGVRNGDLSPKHRLDGVAEGKVRLFEVHDVEKMCLDKLSSRGTCLGASRLFNPYLCLISVVQLSSAPSL